MERYNWRRRELLGLYFLKKQTELRQGHPINLLKYVVSVTINLLMLPGQHCFIFSCCYREIKVKYLPLQAVFLVVYFGTWIARPCMSVNWLHCATLSSVKLPTLL